MQKRFVLISVFFVLAGVINAQVNQSLPWFIHGVLNTSMTYTPGYFKINDFITNDYEKIYGAEIWTGTNVKVLTNGSKKSGGFFGGFASSVNLPIQKQARFHGFKYNIGLVLYKAHHYFGPQFSFYFSRKQSDYFFDGNYLNVPTYLVASFTDSKQDHVRFKQNIIGLCYDLAIAQNGNSTLVKREIDAHFRFSMGIEYILPSSNWSVNKVLIPDFSQNNLFSGAISFQIDFGKCTPKLLR
jgi:hypothetical protein